MAESTELTPTTQSADSTSKKEADPTTGDSTKDGTSPSDSKSIVASAAASTTAARDLANSSGSSGSESVAQLPPQASLAQEPRPKSTDPPPYTQRQVFIALMGKTGTGKTTFINQISGQNLQVGHGLQSCTENIGFAHKAINGDLVTFIDTPGFDDSDRDDGEILALIGAWLKTAHNNNELLSGVIYLHSITDTRISLSSRRSLATLKKMCGTENFQNIALATTMWDTVDPKTGEQRERELKVNLEFWAQMVKEGATVFRHDRKEKSAKEIVMNLLPKKSVVLDIQAEMSSNDGVIGKTTAGSYVKKFLEDRQTEYAERIFDLRTQMAELQVERDLERDEAERTKAELKRDMEKMAEDVQLLMTKVDTLVKSARVEEPTKRHPKFMNKLLDLLTRMERKGKSTEAG